MMIVSKKNRTTVFTALFKDGVMTAPLNYKMPKHPELDVPNLEVCKLMQSLESRGYVKKQYNWRWFYWTLTDAGIEYLREFLHLPAEVVPQTLTARARPAVRGERPERGDRRDRPERGERGDRGERRPPFNKGGERPRFAAGRAPRAEGGEQ